MSNAPIVLFVYNRPWHTEQCLESLLRCEGASDSELYIFCDGPKRPKNKEAVEKVRELVRSRKWCGLVHITEREKNMGLANSVVTGVTDIVNRVGRVIVLEDDLVLSPQFLNYMNDALEIYKDEEKVMHVSGYMYPVKGRLPETFFYRNTSCWGWATWKRAWDMFEPDANKLLAEIEKDRVKRKKFDIEGSMNFCKMLRDQVRGNVDSWAIRWYASVFLREGLCLHPGRSLVNNIGLDSTGSHRVSSNAFDAKMTSRRISDFTMSIRENEWAVGAMVRFYRANIGLLPLRMINRMMQAVKGAEKQPQSYMER